MSDRSSRYLEHSDSTPRIFRSWSAASASVVVAALLAGALTAPAAAQDPVTPTPTLTRGVPCPARVTLNWDVSSIPNANGILWEVDGDPGFQNPTGPEPGRLGAGVASGTVGSVVLDLREAGQVLDGTRYHLRVVAKNGNQDVARRSDAVVFDLDRSPDGTYEALALPDGDRIELRWGNLQADIRSCSDAIFWEIKEGSAFTSQGADPGRFDSGSAPLSANRTEIGLGGRAPGTFYVRLVGKHGGLSPDDDVGRRGTGVAVAVGLSPPPPPPAPPPPPSTPPPPAPSLLRPEITSFSVGRGGSATAGSVPFRFTASGPAPRAYKVAECKRFGTLRGGFVPLPADGGQGLAIELEAGAYTVCLQLATDPRNPATVSDVAQARVTVSPAPPPQGLPTFTWHEVKTVCDFGRQPGTDAVPFENGTYWIPLDQLNAARRCNLVVLWRSSGPAFNTGEPGINAELVREGGQRLGAAGRIGPSDTLRTDLPLRDLPFGPTPFRAGLRVARANGEVHLSEPPLLRFGRSGTTDFQPPAITAFRILEPGTGRVLSQPGASTTNPMVQLDLTTTGGQPTEILIGERPGPGFRDAAWRPYAPNTGQFGGVQMYTLQGQTSGRKTIHVKVRSGSVESESLFASIDFVELAIHRPNTREALDFARDQDFVHSRQGDGTYCYLATQDEVHAFPPRPGLAFMTGRKCRVTLFAGRRLAAGWTVVSIRTGEVFNGRVRMLRSAVRDDPRTEFEVERDVTFPLDGLFAGPVYGELVIELRGPAGADWRDAFRR